MMAWELLERNSLTAITETGREELGLRVMIAVFADDAAKDRLQEMTALFSAAVIYLVLRRRKIRRFNGLDLTDEVDWARIMAGVATMAATLSS